MAVEIGGLAGDERLELLGATFEFLSNVRPLLTARIEVVRY